ncbi:Plasma membrane t-SNARE, secretory vesicle fusion, partial [Quaeritorhiza haematococci]
QQSGGPTLNRPSVEVGLIAGDSSGQDENAHLAECDRLESQIADVTEMINQLEKLYAECVISVDNKATSDRIDALSSDIRLAIQRLRGNLKSLVATTAALPPRTRSTAIRRNAESRVASRLRDAAQSYRDMQQRYQAEYKERLERQYRIVRPEATKEEIEDAVSRGGGIFSREILASSIGEQKRALEEVQTRHAAIREIEKSVTELFELIRDMNEMLAAQQQQIDAIEYHVEETKENVIKGEREIESGIVLRKDSRRKQWILLGIVAVIALILIIILVARFANNSGSNNNTTTTSSNLTASSTATSTQVGAGASVLPTP